MKLGDKFSWVPAEEDLEGVKRKGDVGGAESVHREEKGRKRERRTGRKGGEVEREGADLSEGEEGVDSG